MRSANPDFASCSPGPGFFRSRKRLFLDTLFSGPRCLARLVLAGLLYYLRLRDVPLAMSEHEHGASQSVARGVGVNVGEWDN